MQPSLYPEILIDQNPRAQLIQISRPNDFHVVLGAGGKPDLEVHEDALVQHKIPLYRRKGGGGTVLLGPHVLVITVHAGVSHPFGHKIYFQAINRAIIATLNKILPLSYQERGISDIAVDERKILGSSLYRRKNYLLYQASLLVEDEMNQMNRFLKAPPRQPDYRNNRDHQSFLTSLRELGLTANWDDLIFKFQQNLPLFTDEFFQILPEPYQ